MVSEGGRRQTAIHARRDEWLSPCIPSRAEHAVECRTGSRSQNVHDVRRSLRPMGGPCCVYTAFPYASARKQSVS